MTAWRTLPSVGASTITKARSPQAATVPGRPGGAMARRPWSIGSTSAAREGSERERVISAITRRAGRFMGRNLIDHVRPTQRGRIAFPFTRPAPRASNRRLTRGRLTMVRTVLLVALTVFGGVLA